LRQAHIHRQQAPGPRLHDHQSPGIAPTRWRPDPRSVATALSATVLAITYSFPRAVIGVPCER